MRSISSETVCTFYYVVFIIYCIIAALSILGTVGVLMTTKFPKAIGISIGVQGVFVGVIAGTMALFAYLLCDRALLAPKKKEEGFGLAQQLIFQGLQNRRQNQNQKRR